MSVTNFNTKPSTKTAVPTIRKVLISKVFGLNKNEARSAAPITDISDISANTEERKENRYKDAIAEIIKEKCFNGGKEND